VPIVTAALSGRLTVGNALAPGAVVRGGRGRNYVIVAPISESEIASTFRGRDSAGVAVFVKQYRDPSVLFTNWFEAYFAYQGEVLRRLAAPAVSQFVVPVQEHFVFDDIYYQVHAWIEGRDLADVVSSGGAVDDPTLWVLARAFLFGLARLHENGVVHSDLKPANLRLATTTTSGGARVDYVRLTDFDWAILADGKKYPWDGGPRGTPLYWSLEHCNGSPVGPASDVQTAALILCELLAGRHPIEVALGDVELTSAMAMEACRELLAARRLPHPRKLRPDLPASVADAIWAALAPDPGARPSAAELHRALLPGALRRTRLRLSEAGGLAWRFDPPADPSAWLELDGTALRMFRPAAASVGSVAQLCPDPNARAWLIAPPQASTGATVEVDGKRLVAPCRLTARTRLTVRSAAWPEPIEFEVVLEPA